MTILLSDVVAQVESSGNPLAMRFEPTFLSTVGCKQAAQNYAADGGYMDMNTAAVICCTSWGKFQIMGANLYGLLEYKKALVDFLTTPADQLTAFRSFIDKIGFTDLPFSDMAQADLLKFAKLYNGSEVYAASLTHAYQGML